MPAVDNVDVTISNLTTFIQPSCSKSVPYWYNALYIYVLILSASQYILPPLQTPKLRSILLYWFIDCDEMAMTSLKVLSRGIPEDNWGYIFGIHIRELGKPRTAWGGIAGKPVDSNRVLLAVLPLNQPARSYLCEINIMKWSHFNNILPPA
jgi:hypothetical protein